MVYRISNDKSYVLLDIVLSFANNWTFLNYALIFWDFKFMAYRICNDFIWQSLQYKMHWSHRFVASHLRVALCFVNFFSCRWSRDCNHLTRSGCFLRLFCKDLLMAFSSCIFCRSFTSLDSASSSLPVICWWTSVRSSTHFLNSCTSLWKLSSRYSR